MANPVVFKFGYKAQYEALQPKDPNALYFLTDSHELYKGEYAIATNSGLYSDIKTIENSDIEVITNYYTNHSKVPFIGDVFIVRTHIVDEDYTQSVYMYDGQNWESISSTIMIEGDNKTIEVDEHNVIALKDYGKRFYKFIEETGSKEDGTFVASHYELVEVDENNPWIAGLEPRVVLEGNEYIIGWYQPNLAAAEGVQNQVVAVQSVVANVQKDVGEVKDDIADLTEILNGTEGQSGLVNDVADITETLYGAGEDATGLIDDVANITQELIDNYYTKTEVDGKVSGVFHFKGTTDSKETLPATENVAGDVYQVDEREYAWNGTEWVELGFVVDLSGHVTKNELKQVTDDLQPRIKELEDVGAEKNVLIGVSVNNSMLVPNEGRIVNIEIPTFDGTIAGLVPVVAKELTDKANCFLNANGDWTTVNIGNLGEHVSITDYVDAKTAEATPIWSEM